MDWIVKLFETKWRKYQPNSYLEFLFNNLWLPPLDIEERAASRVKYRRLSLGTETWSQRSTCSRGAQRLKTLTNPEIFRLREKDNGYTQFQLRISFQQFVVATTGRRGESSITSQISKAVTWNGNMKSKKSRKELEFKEFGMIQARQHKPKNYVVLKQQSAWRHSRIQKHSSSGKDNGQSRKKQACLRMDRIYADQFIRPKPSCETRKGKNETKGVALWN